MGRPRSSPIAAATLLVALLAASVALAVPASADPGVRHAEAVHVESARTDQGVHRNELYVTRLGGSGKELLLARELGRMGTPRLSPQGSMIVMDHDRVLSGGRGLLILARDGSGLRALTSAPVGLTDHGASWTPDGSAVLFTRSTYVGSTDGELMRVAAAGGAVTALGIPAIEADVSSSGRVAYTRPDGRMATFPLAGGTEVLLPVTGAKPAWSPDGREIAYVGRADRGYAYVYVVAADGSGNRRLDDDLAWLNEVSQPQWLPDGESVVYGKLGSNVKDPSELVYTVDRHGRGGLFLGDPGVRRAFRMGNLVGPPALPVAGAGQASRFVPVEPVRAYDSRPGELPLSGSKARLGAGQSVEVSLPGVPADATAAVLNVTAVQPSAFTYVTAYPTGTAVPTASSVNVPAGEVIPNNVTVKLGTGGRVSLFNAAGTTDVIVDLAGFYAPTATAGPSSAGFASQAPVRVYDSRPGETPAGLKGQLGAGASIDVPVAGAGLAVPADATAVVLNITGINPSTDTLLRAYPTPAGGDDVPTVSNLNLPPGTISANLAVVKIGAGGTVRLRNDLGTVDAVLDVAGYYSPTALGQFVPVDPTRFLDTRNGTGTAPLALGEQTSLDLRVTGFRGIPAGATAVAANLTAVLPTATTLLRAYPAADGSPVPTVSNLNLETDQIRANAAYLVPATTGHVRLRNDTGEVHTLTDVAGYFTEPA